MFANEIEDVLNKLSKLSYDSILINGNWGIGKTYSINEFVKHNENAFTISFFGLENVEQIFHELLFKTMNNDGLMGKLSAGGLNAISKFSSALDKIKGIKGVMDSFISEKDIFKLLTQEFDTCHIIIFDDIERMSSDLDFKKVLGVIEEIKKYNNVKVVLVSNIAELCDGNKELFEKFCEKVIDKKYIVTEHSNNIDWEAIHIDSVFIEDFLKKHQVDNIRTLIKAQNFYEDVRLECYDIDDVGFLHEIRLVCYAIVIEDIEKLYFVEESEDKNDKIPIMVKNEFSYRVGRYIPYIRSNSSLLDLIYKYYLNKLSNLNEQLKIEHDNYIKNGETPMFYKDDEEVQCDLKYLEKDIKKVNNVVQLSKVVDKYVYWAKIIQVEYDDIIDYYKSKLDNMILSLIDTNEDNVLYYSIGLFDFSMEEVKSVYENKITEAREKKIRIYIDYLQHTTNDQKAYDYSYNLRKCYDNIYFKSIIDNCIEELLTRSSFPIDDMNEEKYHVCYNIMYLLDKYDNKKLLGFCEDLSKECDHMANNRMEYIVKQIIKGY